MNDNSDAGSIGTFQDIPLSLQIVVRREFLDLTACLNSYGSEGKNGSSCMGTPFPYSGSAEGDSSVQKCAQAANDLLIWLTEVGAGI